MRVTHASLVGLVLLAGGAAPVVAGPADECGVQNASQVEIHDCLVAVEKNADAALATIYGYAMNAAEELDKVTAPRADTVPALKAARDAWAQYRDRHCGYVGATFGGGSGTGIAILGCRIELTRARSRELMKSTR